MFRPLARRRAVSNSNADATAAGQPRRSCRGPCRARAPLRCPRRPEVESPGCSAGRPGQGSSGLARRGRAQTPSIPPPL
eukprot:6122483-Heterocapsa_arctica.AAC.1